MQEFEGLHPQVTRTDEQVARTDLEQELAACRRDLRELRDHLAASEIDRERFLRRVADVDNARKRAERAAAEDLRLARQGLLGAFLPVADNLDRALCAPPGDPQALRRGVEMVRRQISDILGQHGIVRMASEGEAFDPLRHEAVETAPGPSGQVLREVEAGYTMDGQLMRPARVVVGRDEEPARRP